MSIATVPRYAPLRERYVGRAGQGLRTITVTIELSCDREWTALLIDGRTRSSFPTKATATLAEGRQTALDRAMRLAEIYLGEFPKFDIRARPEAFAEASRAPGTA